MRKYILTALFSVALVIGTVPAYAEQDRTPNLDFDGEITIGAVLGEEFLKQALPGVDQPARDILSSVEGNGLGEDLSNGLVSTSKSPPQNNRTTYSTL